MNLLPKRYHRDYREWEPVVITVEPKGITIQNVLKANGSPRAIVVTDEERTFFRITIPCHEAAGNIIADIASKDNRDPKDDPIEFTDRQKVIIEMIIADPFLSAKAISEKMSEKMSEKEGTNERTIERDLAKLKKLGVLTREGGRKEGKWVIMIEK